MLALTFTTGIADAVGYLGLDRVFTANMTGNVVILGMALAGADGLPVLGPSVALGGFLAGALAAGRLLRRAPAGWSVRTTTAFTAAATGCLVVAAATLVRPPVAPSAYAAVVTGALAAALGIQAAAARRLAVRDVTTVVVTSTLTGLAADSRLAGGPGVGGGRRVLVVVLLTAGAAVGALLLTAGGDRGVGLGALVAGLGSAVCVLVGHRRGRSS
ncbi:DUF1275 family protein [Cellulomonas sp. DKR-3]|uniref:DUF1275 family protein n=2 Tax=Cellulomonas fulva TaxID=2835530 RepID=A0ABS5TX81_9CELL|nr:DUF1275 family protein [Cellulomonas fulva]